MSEISTSVDPIRHEDDVDDTLHEVNSMGNLMKVRRFKQKPVLMIIQVLLSMSLIKKAPKKRKYQKFQLEPQKD